MAAYDEKAYLGGPGGQPPQTGGGPFTPTPADPSAAGTPHPYQGGKGGGTSPQAGLGGLMNAYGAPSQQQGPVMGPQAPDAGKGGGYNGGYSPLPSGFGQGLANQSSGASNTPVIPDGSLPPYQLPPLGIGNGTPAPYDNNLGAIGNGSDVFGNPQPPNGYIQPPGIQPSYVSQGPQPYTPGTPLPPPTNNLGTITNNDLAGMAGAPAPMTGPRPQPNGPAWNPSQGTPPPRWDSMQQPPVIGGQNDYTNNSPSGKGGRR